jgi:hypothetical protein
MVAVSVSFVTGTPVRLFDRLKKLATDGPSEIV